jgi:hypothetical protein
MAHPTHHLDAHHIAGYGGAAAELLRQGGYMSGQVGRTLHQGLTHRSNHAGHAGAHTVQALASYAPATVAALGVMAPPVALVAGMAYLGYRFFRWLNR